MGYLLVKVDDPNAVAGHIWSVLPATAGRTMLEDVEGGVATVTLNGMRLDVAFDPDEDGLMWRISADTFGDNSQWDDLAFGGWAPGDEETAAAEIAEIIRTLNGAD